MLKLLPDSKGCIKKVLFHHAPVYHDGNLIQEGIFKSFLHGINQTGIKPEVFVFATYVSEEEKETLALEANTWKDLAKNLEYIEIQIDSVDGSKPPYPQDTCIVLDEDPSTFIISKSPRFNKHPKVRTKIENLLIKAKLRLKKLTTEYNLEGGYVYATSDKLFYSNPLDHQVIRQFKQEAIFIENLLGRLTEQIIYILIPGSLIFALPEHVDLMLSLFETNNSLELFYVDFREIMLSSPYLNRDQRILLSRQFDKWDQDMKKLLDRIKSRVKNVEFHKIPGFIDCKEEPGVYSATNLLFHSTKRNYAFYLKCPRIVEEEYNFQINKQVEKILKEVNVSPIPVAGTNEITNMNHVYNSAGLRCLVKVLSRT